MFKIVLFLEKSDEAWSTPLKIGFLFLNRLIIDEEAALEVIGKNPKTRKIFCSLARLQCRLYIEYDMAAGRPATFFIHCTLSC